MKCGLMQPGASGATRRRAGAVQYSTNNATASSQPAVKRVMIDDPPNQVSQSFALVSVMN